LGGIVLFLFLFSERVSSCSVCLQYQLGMFEVVPSFMRIVVLYFVPFFDCGPHAPFPPCALS